MQYKNNNGYIARKLENQSKKVREIFKQLDREWVLELFTKAQNEKWILGYLCLEYYKITNDLIFKTKLDKYGINDSNPTGNKAGTGITGDLVEYMVTGEKRDSAAEADLYKFIGKKIDIKCLGFAFGILTEKLSLTSVTWEGKKALRTTEFKDSNIFTKSKLLVPMFSDELSEAHKLTRTGSLSTIKGKKINHLKRVFIGFKYVDLGILLKRAEVDYNFYRQTVLNKGEQYTCYELGSKQWCFDTLGNIQLQTNPEDKTQVLHKKQASNGKKQAKDRIIEGGTQKTYPQKWNIGVEVMMNNFFK
jgi:hypothetical protein